jgi:hypothetical protein
MAEDRVKGAVASPANLSDEEKENLKALGYTH